MIEDLLAVHLIDERTPDRFGFHDLIREFAQETSLRIDPEHARSGAFRRLVSVAIATVDRADRLINPHQFRLPVPAELLAPAARDFPHLPDWLGPDEARTWLATEMPALLAVEHTLRANGRPAPAAWLAHLLTPHLEAAGLWHEALRVHREAARHWRSAAHPQNEVHALIGLSMIQLRVSQYAEATAGAEQALALARTAGDRTAQAEALGRLGEVHWERGEFARAMELQHEVLQLRRSTEDRWGLARALNNTGLLAARTGDHKTSRKSFSEALSIFEELDDLKGQLNTLNNIGGLLLEIGDKESARRTFTRLSRHEAVAQDSMAMAIVRLNLAQTVHLPAESVEATALLDSAIQTFRRTGSPKHEIDATNVLGGVQLAAGRPGSAAELFRRSLTLSRQIGAVDEAATALAGLGQAERLLYAPPAPRAHREETAARPMAEFHRTGTNPAKPGPE
ncbi:tetratricopeptide repeat protein [Kitasatospora sp. NPDC051984]|uniref:tetratricopeptide repeat protein n=1 Tax=Kitasatospora sp. NPDC051984 TaxID=3364059 RepID=UPI0037C9E2E5